jgi:hypothetical protein
LAGSTAGVWIVASGLVLLLLLSNMKSHRISILGVMREAEKAPMVMRRSYILLQGLLSGNLNIGASRRLDQ